MSVPTGYERDKTRELEDVCRKMLAMPGVVMAIENRSAIVLTCPRGHKISTVVLEVDSNGWMINVRVISEMGRASGSVAVRDHPFNRAPKCLEPGCGGSVDRDGWCPDHGGRDALVIDYLGTRFVCRRCRPSWDDRVTLSRLLKSITAALLLGHSSASVTGQIAGVSRRRR
jgi:hypothetical protein